MLTYLTSPALDFPAVRHGFFTRQGGVSQGVYAQLNGGVGSRDAAAAVAQNRALMAQALNVPPTHLLVPYQIHSVDVCVVDAPWAADQRPRCDGLVTRTKGVALGVTGADCGMILFCDPVAQVIGAAHAGWKGALGDVIESVLQAMEQNGAQRAQIHMALGPMIAQSSYEVGAEFRARFLDAASAYDVFFKPATRAEHFMFDLPAFIAARAQAAGIAHFHNLAFDTYADEARFYSYRRSVHRGEDDYGRLVSAIVLR